MFIAYHVARIVRFYKYIFKIIFLNIFQFIYVVSDYIFYLEIW